MPPLADLPAAYLALEREHGELKGVNQALHDEVATLRWQLEKMRKMVFGPGRSEKLDRAQLTLALRELEAAVEAAERPSQKLTYERRAPAAERRPAADTLFEKLPVAEVVVIEPEAVKADPQAYERIGEEKTFEVEVTPPRLWKREIVRPKYKAKADRAQPPVVAPAPSRAVPGGHASAGLLAWVCVAKYLDHLPLYRQEKQLARWGAQIPRSTLCEWIRIAADWLEPIYKTMLRRLLEDDYVQADETPIKCQDPDQPGLGIFQGYLWVVTRPGADVCFDWRTSRRHDEASSLLKGFKGVLQADGYAAYDALGAERPAGEITRLGCWAHARRKVFEAQAEDPREAKILLRFIGWMYHREKQWDEVDAKAERERDPVARAKLRQAHFTRGLVWLHARVLRLRERVRPKSGLGAAAGYLLGQWESLRAHLSHGQTRLDTNVVENHIRPTALGKKNWLFIGHPDAGKRTAILYSIIISCLCHGHDPEAYIRDLLTRLPTMSNKHDLGPLTPSRWKAPTTPAVPRQTVKA
jgi:transposase